MREIPLQSERSNVLAGLAVRVPDSSLEPLLPEGSWVLIASSAAVPVRGVAVLVEAPTGERLLGYFISSDTECGVLLMRTRPQPLESRLWWLPIGSRIIGVITSFEISVSVKAL